MAGRALTPPRHICCFFESDDERYDALAPYFTEGIANGELVLTVTDADRMAGHLARLSARAVGIDDAQRSGHLCALHTDDTYLAGGSFVKQRMLDALRQRLDGIAASGFTRLRTCGDMSWAQRNMPGTEELLAYESEVNALLDTHDAAFLCLYDASRISGRAMLDILATHTHVLIGSVVHDNPYFMPLDEQRQTRSRGT